jgi:transposase, IS6 family
VISVAVRWYLRYGLSYRDVEELLAERGVTVDHATVYDETYLKVVGQWIYLYRAVDQHGQVVDVLLSGRRDLAAARRFFTRALRAGTVPAEVTTETPSSHRLRTAFDELVLVV